MIESIIAFLIFALYVGIRLWWANKEAQKIDDPEDTQNKLRDDESMPVDISYHKGFRDE